MIGVLLCPFKFKVVHFIQWASFKAITAIRPHSFPCLESMFECSCHSSVKIVTPRMQLPACAVRPHPMGLQSGVNGQADHEQ